jgi:hypothetical protein
MKPIHILFCLLLFISNALFAQSYGNEWIQYNQKYYSFKIVTTGIHKLDYSTLSNAGVPLTSFTSANIQLFGREKEIPLFIEDGGDQSLDSGDYILFYAERNDAWLDATLYESSDAIGNPKYSLYNDTIQYFFTWNSSTSNLRFSEEISSNYTNFTASDFILFEKSQYFSNYYNEGEKTSDASSSFYTSGEGWGLTPVNGANGHTWNYNNVFLDNIYQGNGSPNILYNAVVVGASNAAANGTMNHHSRHTIGNSNYVIADSVFNGYKAIVVKKSFPSLTLPSNGLTNLKVSIVNDLGAVTDYQSINYWSLTYPRSPNLGALTSGVFNVFNGVNQSKSRIDLSNTAFNNPYFFVLGTSPKRIIPSQNGTQRILLIPNSAIDTIQQVVFQEQSTFTSVTQIQPVNASGFFTNYANLSPENAVLMIYHPQLKTASEAYALYRSSNAGGNHTVILANVTELYLQYGGGIDKHINGIRRFAQHMYSITTQKPKALFLMGKGIREASIAGITVSGPGTRTTPSVYNMSLIPSFGQPSSDNCITSNLPGTTKWTPLIPTGRISVSSNQELTTYLDKIKQHDLNQDQTSVYNSASKDWQKQVLHFVGGSNAGQQSTFQGYMNGLKNTISTADFGGNVMTSAKTNDNPLSPSELTAITNRIQEGVSLITFFGHAAPTNTGFEINIDEPINWNNQGKYPIVITNSCYNGNIFQNSISKSEQFVNAQNAGSIAYLGTVSLGISNTLYQFSNELYKQFSTVNYGGSLASQIKNVIQNIETPQSNLLVESTCTQMTLNGDPLLKLNWHTKPEIEITQESVSFSPTELDLTVDSITIKLELKNLGKSITDTFQIEVSRNFPSTSIDSVYSFFVPSLHYKHTLSFKVPLEANIGIGINNFNFKVDLPSFISEQYDEIGNNQLTKTLFIDISGIEPVLPYEFAVVPDASVTLKASTINPIAAFNTYRFEIDTIDFVGAQSPFHRYATVSGLGGVKEVLPSEWKLSSSGNNAPFIAEDSVVYFWRVAVDVPSKLWKESSFQYIPSKTGWGQDHFFQFKNNGFSGIQYDRTDRKKYFDPLTKSLTCDVKYSGGVPAIYYNAYSIDGTQQEYGICQYTPSFYVAVIDPFTLKSWGTRWTNNATNPPTVFNPNHYFGNANDNSSCRNRVEKYFIFRQNNATQLAAFEAMMDTIPNDYYILVYSPMTTLYDQINTLAPSVFSTFQNLGSDSIVPGRPNMPMAFFCKKGDPSTVIELFSQTVGEDLHLEADLVGFSNIGQEDAPLIGPASNWKSIYWKQDPFGSVNADTTKLSIKMFDANGVYQTKIDTLFTPNDSIVTLSNLIDANQYPFVQLNAFYKDPVGFTPAQIDRWHVLFTPLPEAAIDGTTAFTWIPNKDSLSEGEEVKFAVDIKNIYSIPMDSLLVNYWVKDNQQQIHVIAYSRQDSLLVGETLRDTITFSTTGLKGNNVLWVEVNPYVNGSLIETDQPEQKHFNNLMQLPFFVNGDDQNPILDVTFDGKHLLNNDIVSPSSEILITLKDDNPYLIMNDISDTTRFGVYLTSPSGVQKRIPFVDGNGITIMQWIPADGQTKRFKIIYSGNFLVDGKYTLFVQGSDRSGNLSGDLEYKISFEVIRESAITYMMNYPNPFSTSTRFVFTLTGDEVPDEVKIQIMTVTGKVVREITEDELGPISIGRNMTNYAWDGKDEFGDQLANGVYLYTVKAQINGEEIKHRASGGDGYFKKEFGKMYLLR